MISMEMIEIESVGELEFLVNSWNLILSLHLEGAEHKFEMHSAVI